MCCNCIKHINFFFRFGTLVRRYHGCRIDKKYTGLTDEEIEKLRNR